jgi:diaminopimelate epimerase
MGKPATVPQNIPIILKQSSDIPVDIISLVQDKLKIKGGMLPVNLISMGNFHAVHFTEKPVIEYPLEQIGPEVEKRYLPSGMNFEVARIINDHLIEVRVWEHGVGETLACGSGACATAVAARIHGRVSKKATVSLPGGKLIIEWDGENEVFLSGSAETVYTGEWPEKVYTERKPVDIKNEVMA